MNKVLLAFIFLMLLVGLRVGYNTHSNNRVETFPPTPSQELIIKTDLYYNLDNPSQAYILENDKFQEVELNGLQ